MDSENIKKQRGKWGKKIYVRFATGGFTFKIHSNKTKQERSIPIAFMNCIQVSKPIKGGYRKSPNHFLDKKKKSCKRNLLLSTVPKESIQKGLEIVDFRCIFQMESTALIIKATKKKNHLNLQETSDMVFITSMHGCVSPDEPTQVTPIHPLSYPGCQPRPNVAVSSPDYS